MGSGPAGCSERRTNCPYVAGRWRVRALAGRPDGVVSCPDDRPDGDQTGAAMADEAIGRILVPLTEAAARLGTTSEALRARIKRGTLQGRQDEGGRWSVWLATDEGQQPNGEPVRESVGLRQYCDRLERDVDRLSDQVSALQDALMRAQTTGQALALTVDRLTSRALPAPVGDEVTEGDDGQAAGVQTDARRPRGLRAWVRRVVGD